MLPPLIRRLQAAEGFLELGLPQLAEAELEELEGDDRTKEAVWAMRCQIYRAGEQWAAMVEVAKHLISLNPGVTLYWLDAAFAVRKTAGIKAAHQLMNLAVFRLQDDPQICYHAACCAAQAGHFDEAKNLLRAAVDKLYELKHKALQDPDLEPLWAQVGI